jgi:hypothetical protein
MLRIERRSINADRTGIAANLLLLFDFVVTWLAQTLQLTEPKEIGIPAMRHDMVSNTCRNELPLV